MKRLSLVVALLLIVAACGGEAADDTSTTAGDSATTAGDTATTAGETTTTAADGGVPEALADVNQITVIVNQSAGGGADAAVRILAPVLERLYGFDVLVENVTEAGGVTGANEVFNSEPDGSVVGALLIPRTIQQQVLLNTDYQTDDFAHILLFRFGSFALTVAADSPYEDFQQFVDASQDEPIPVGVTGPGSATDLQAAVLADVAGANIIRVPFDGAADVQTAILGGNIDAGMLPLNADILEDQYRILVVPRADEFTPYPDLPTLGDFGLPSADVSFYQGFFGPSGMSEDVRVALEEVFRAALSDPDVQAQFETAGYFTVLLGGEEMTALINEQGAIIDQYIDLLRGG